ncbi:hypothetical protein MJ561_18625 [Klebsiella pneumoniae]|nr:hypothetical protein MJ561_18625 [Klebsiella pneumoniae]
MAIEDERMVSTTLSGWTIPCRSAVMITSGLTVDPLEGVADGPVAKIIQQMRYRDCSIEVR